MADDLADLLQKIQDTKKALEELEKRLREFAEQLKPKE